MRIVALVPGGIGDQLLFFPTLDDLKRYYPDAEVDVVVEPRAKGAYRVSQSVRDVWLYDFKDRNAMADWGNLLGILRDREYDVVISLGRRWSVGLLLWLTGIGKRVGYAGTPGEGFLTDLVPLKTEQYVAHMYHDLLSGLGVNSPCPPIAIKVPKPDIQWAEAEQQRLGVKESGYILIHGGSGELGIPQDPEKVYPAPQWQQVIQDLQQRQPTLPVVVVKGPGDEAFVTKLLELCPTLKVTEPDDMGKLAAIIAAANLMLCTDGAPMQLAVAVQTYTIALFGPADPAKFLPQNDRLIGIKSPTGNLADIAAQDILKKVWGG